MKLSNKRFISYWFTTLIGVLFLCISTNIYAQCGPPPAANCQGIPASELIRSTPANEAFTFDSFSEYNGGITISGSTLLRLKVLPNNASCKWILRVYIDNNGGATPVNEWETLNTYGAGSGIPPTLDLLEFKVYNSAGTPISNAVYQNFVPAVTGSFIDIINDPLAINPAGGGGTNVNGAGTYLTNYDEYSFTIDYKIVPGLNYTPGMYQVILKFCLVEAL